MLQSGAQWLSTRSEGWVLPNADLRVRFQDARHHRARSTSIVRSRFLPYQPLAGISAILSVRHVAPRWWDGRATTRGASRSIGGGPLLVHTDRASYQLSVGENATSWGV